MSGRRHLDDLDVLRRHAFAGQHAPQEKEVHGETARDRDALALQVPVAGVAGIAAYHDHGAGAVAEGDDPERDLLVGKVHHQRRQHVRRLDAPGHERFLHLGPAAVLAVFELPRARHAGDGQGEVAGDRQATDDEGSTRGARAGGHCEGHCGRGRAGQDQPSTQGVH
jgi:hypothetical protein